jgi:hypothetical protein
VLFNLLVILAGPAAADAQPRVHVGSGDRARPFAQALGEELQAEATLVRTLTQADVRILLLDEGRHLVVRDNAGRLLVQRSLDRAGPPSNRVFVALAAQAIRTYTSSPPQTRTATTTLPRIAKPEVSALGRTPPKVPRGRAPSPVPSSQPEQSMQLVIGGEVQGGTWTDLTTRQVGFGLSGALVGQRWMLAARLAGHGGAVLSTGELQANLTAAQLLVEGGATLFRGGPMQVQAYLGAGLGLFWGTARAVKPAFASPGSSVDLRLLEPMLAPGVSLRLSVSDRVGLYLRMSAKIALATHRIGLPSAGPFSDAAPVQTARIQPWAAVGVDWQLFK